VSEYSIDKDVKAPTMTPKEGTNRSIPLALIFRRTESICPTSYRTSSFLSSTRIPMSGPMSIRSTVMRPLCPRELMDIRIEMIRSSVTVSLPRQEIIGNFEYSNSNPRISEGSKCRCGTSRSWCNRQEVEIWVVRNTL
jgi:hypothetical protein